MKPESNMIKFSHSLDVLFVNCLECNTEHALDLLGIFFSNIDVANTKEEAWEYFSKSKYDLIILGLKIPEIDDGIALIEQIREVSKDITILSIAPEVDQFVYTKLIELHIDGFIIKPIYIKQFSDVIHKSLEHIKNKEDLYHYKCNLEKKVQEQVEQLREKDKILFHQSKLAAMGEMIDAVAHQWKQPINSIKVKVDILEYDYEDHLVDEKYIHDFKSKIFTQIDHMTDTLNDFRSFFRPNEEQQEFYMKPMLDKALLLLHDELIQNSIKVTVDIQNDFTLLGVESEFIHLVLNIINNSKDAFNERDIEKRETIINVFKDEQYKKIEIEDNAGGIPEDVIGDIFKVNITTKQKSGGTGIGLYLSSQIAQKYHGRLEVKNLSYGARFTFSCPTSFT